ncbi:hypothetical protein TNIN_401111, partial [Trichonephila inaurata madagascariensis]
MNVDPSVKSYLEMSQGVPSAVWGLGPQDPGLFFPH